MSNNKYQHFKSIAANIPLKNERKYEKHSTINTDIFIEHAHRSSSKDRRYLHLTHKEYKKDEDRSQNYKNSTKKESESETSRKRKRKESFKEDDDYSNHKKHRRNESTDRRQRNQDYQPKKRYESYGREQKDPARNNRERKETDSRRERYDHKARYREDNKTVEKTLKEKIEEIIVIEDHHIEEVCRNSKGDVDYVVWCPKYVNPKIKGRIIGGKALLHHKCRVCGQICLHLLGRYGSSDRKCLKCKASDEGWDERDVPSWYYHPNRCRFCR